jgi:hypothetical protein
MPNQAQENIGVAIEGARSVLKESLDGRMALASELQSQHQSEIRRVGLRQTIGASDDSEAARNRTRSDDARRMALETLGRGYPV